VFRYIRYNALGLRRAALKLDDDTSANVANVKRRSPRRSGRLGTLDPETSLIVWQDEVVNTSEVAPSPLVETSPADSALMGPEPQIEGA
jgi:hypothetical protein